MYIIDRFKGDWAIIESDRKTFKLPQDLVPQEDIEHGRERQGFGKGHTE